MGKYSYSDTTAGSAINFQIDEMMIANMLEALKNPLIGQMFEPHELTVMCQVIKSHVVSNAYAISETQNKTRLGDMFKK